MPRSAGISEAVRSMIQHLPSQHLKRGKRARLAHVWPLLLVCLAILPTATWSNQAGYRVEQVHAAFLYNLARFVSWPESSFQGPGTPLYICFLGSTTVIDLLRQAVAGEQVQGRPLATRQLRSLDGAESCHMLFFTSRSARLYADRLHNLQQSPILLISPLHRFAESGGMLALVERDNRIHPVINLGAVNRAGIVISSKLLRLATITRGDDS